MDNYYEILNVTNEADLKQIKKAYAKLIRQYPPESFPEEFKKIRKAYEVLSNLELRICYDKRSCDKEGSYTNSENRNCHDYIYEDRNELDKQEESVEITSKSDFKDVMRVYFLHFNNKNYIEAERTLNLAIDKTSINNSNNIMFYFQLLELHIYKRDMDTFINKLNELFESVTLVDKKDERVEYLYSNLKKLNDNLLSSRKILYWLIVKNKITYLETGAQVNPYELIDEYKLIYNRYSKDYKNSPSFRILLEVWFENSMSEGEKQNKLWVTENGIYKADSVKVLASIKRLRKKYKKLYNIDKQYFEEMYNDIKNASEVEVSDFKFNSKLIFAAILISIYHPLIFLIPLLLLYHIISKRIQKR